MGGIQLQESAVARSTRPSRLNATSLTVYLGGCAMLFLISALPNLHPGLPSYSTLGTYRASGLAVANGKNPYVVFPENLRLNYSLVGGPGSVPDLNLNPPCMLPLFQIMSHISLEWFARVWTVGSFAVMIFTVALLLWGHPQIQNRQILWLLLCLPTRDCIEVGQIYFLLFSLSAIAWVALERRTSRLDLLAAVAIGMAVAIKPTFLFWPAFLFLRGDRKLALHSMGIAFAVSAAPILLYGPNIYGQWIHAFAGDQHWRSAGNIAIAPYFRRLGLRPLGIAVAWVVAAILAWRVWKKTPSRESTTMVGLSAAILCAPLAWVGYALLLAPGFVTRRWGALSSTAATLLFVPPSVAIYRGGHLGMAIGSGVYFAGVWIILYKSLWPGSQALQPPSGVAAHEIKETATN